MARRSSAFAGLLALCAARAAAEGDGVQVIVAGLGRTGTMSMQAALRILGYKTYHMEELMRYPEQAALWRSYVEGQVPLDDLLGRVSQLGYTATMDSPMCDVFEAQVRLFPDAKVILTEHPRGRLGWAKSFATLLEFVVAQSSPFSWTYPNFLSFVPMFRDLNAVRCMIGTPTMGVEPCELMYKSQHQPAEWWGQRYDQHNAKVRAAVPKGRLLEFSVTQGWGPLCAFLGKPVPDVPFPAVNDSAALRNIARVFRTVIYAWVPCCFALVAFCIRRRCGSSGAAAGKAKVG